MKQLVQSILSGDKEAFREIVRRYAPGVRAFLACNLCDQQMIDDLTQETFIASYQNLHQADLDQELGPWIKGIARNKLRMYLRTYYRKQDVFQSLKFELIEDIVEEIDTMSEEDKEQIDNLQNCIKQLPKRSREIIKARYFSNETVGNLAQRLQSTVTAMSSVIYRSKQILKDCVKQAVNE
ncbi:MAG: sigma-70 family RNA polymerase sigma factor [Lentisphaeraceae bacterium]|nr:sigma-70 family RNA polymerase sigma factor [Lentisphaeraceae bacterium]